MDAALPQPATQLLEQGVQAAVDVEGRRQTEESSDLAGREIVIEAELEEQTIRRREACGRRVEGPVQLTGLERRGRVRGRRRELFRFGFPRHEVDEPPTGRVG